MSAAHQRSLIFQALKLGALTTIQARKEHDVLHPAMRVRELREVGHEIATTWASVKTDSGRTTRVACYHLIREAKPCADNQNDKSPMAVGLCLEPQTTSDCTGDSTSREVIDHYPAVRLHHILLGILRRFKRPYSRKGQFRSAVVRLLDAYRQNHGAIRYECPPPCVPVEHVRAAGGQWFLIVEVCPFCGCRHWHGGGNGDAHGLYGHRSAHCGCWFDTPGYILIPKGGEA